jgi:hypothetical protein
VWTRGTLAVVRVARGRGSGRPSNRASYCRSHVQRPTARDIEPLFNCPRVPITRFVKSTRGFCCVAEPGSGVGPADGSASRAGCGGALRCRRSRGARHSRHLQAVHPDSFQVLPMIPPLPGARVGVDGWPGRLVL